MSGAVRTYPGPLPIEWGQGLTREQRSVERRFALLVQACPDVFVAAYRYYNGKRLNTDDARELCVEYGVSLESRARLAAAVQEPAGAIVKDAWRRLLSDGSGEGLVVFTAGGAGSGKSSAIRDVPHARILEREADAVYDTTMADLSSSRKKTRQALDVGKQVMVFYVYRPLETVIQGVVERAEGRGRTVPARVLARDHFLCPRTMLQLTEDHKFEPRFIPFVLNNSGNAGEASVVDLDFLRSVAYNDLADPTEVGRRVRKVVQDEYDKRAGSCNPLPGYVYEGILGKAH